MTLQSIINSLSSKLILEALSNVGVYWYGNSASEGAYLPPKEWLPWQVRHCLLLPTAEQKICHVSFKHGLIGCN
jgi:hypothetical protein